MNAKCLYMVLCTAIIYFKPAIPEKTTCPPQCQCERSAKRVVCLGDRNPLETLTPGMFPKDTKKLDLSENKLTRISSSSLRGLTQLRELTISYNHISVLESAAFEDLKALQKMDFEVNRLTELSPMHFVGLDKLTNLNLRRNRLTSFDERVLASLPSLQKLNLNGNPLKCTCEIRWLLERILNKTSKPKITSGLKCKLNGTEMDMRKLTLQDIPACGQATIFELHPDKSQLIFVGDTIHLSCTSRPQAQLTWSHESVDLSNFTFVTNNSQGYKSRVELPDSQFNYSGRFNCEHPSQGVKSVLVKVVGKSYCPPKITRTGLLRLNWPRTVAGLTASLRCPFNENIRKATHKCNQTGQWSDLNTTACKTRPLSLTEKFSRVLSFLNKSKTVEDTLDQLQLLYATVARMEDLTTHQINRISMVFGKLYPIAIQNSTVLQAMTEVVSLFSEPNKANLQRTQVANLTCSRLRLLFASIASNTAGQMTDVKSERIMFHVERVLPRHYKGITCLLISPRKPKGLLGSDLQCYPNSNSTYRQISDYVYHHRNISLAIILPVSLLRGFHGLKLVLRLSVYNNDALFPILPEWKTLSSPIVSAHVADKAGDFDLINMTEPVRILYRVSQSPKAVQEYIRVIKDDDFNHTPSFWDASSNGGRGDWRGKGCRTISGEGDHLLATECNRLGYFALVRLEDVPKVTWSDWFPMELAVYFATAGSAFFHAICIITYITCFRYIEQPRKLKHTLINLWISIMAVEMCFCMGIHRTREDNPYICYSFGITLHYLSLTSFCWVCLVFLSLYTSLRKSYVPKPPPTDGEEEVPGKPVFKYYLLGWGVSGIIVGITAAVNLANYRTDQFCFLAFEPLLAAFFLPVAIPFVCSLVLFIMIICMVKQPPLEDASRQALLDTTHDLVVDRQYKPCTRSLSALLVLLLHAISWLIGSMLVSQLLKPWIPDYRNTVSYAYASAVGLLAVYNFFFHCLSRTDVRDSWCRFIVCSNQSHIESVHDKVKTPRHQNGVSHHKPVLPHKRTNHYATPDNYAVTPEERLEKRMGRVIGTPRDEMSDVMTPTPAFQVPPRPQYASSQQQITSRMDEGTPESSLPNLHNVRDFNYPAFYNPNQNGVAKKFWEKNRHQQQLQLLKRDLRMDTDSELEKAKEEPIVAAVPNASDVSTGGSFGLLPPPPSLKSSSHKLLADDKGADLTEPAANQYDIPHPPEPHRLKPRRKKSDTKPEERRNDRHYRGDRHHKRHVAPEEDLRTPPVDLAPAAGISPKVDASDSQQSDIWIMQPGDGEGGGKKETSV